ncbi:MAG: acetyl-CoA decarbonylase/synthase complex subunit beta, partial [Crenarchaeota archaeon]|nr:acetyl-CoA decarbonylase/synthase complex subunit beta [Thermoproteota archaeon]
IEYMRSEKFFAADGGWNRIVWIPKDVKEKVKDFIPKDIIDKIATEEDAKNVDELKAFLQEKKHPVVAKWETEEPPAEETAAITVNEEAAGTMMPVATAGSIPIMAGGFKIILKDAKIFANKVIIQTVKDDKKA